MSLFEDDMYVYRDTFFVLFERKNRPTTEQVRTALSSLGNRYDLVTAEVSSDKPASPGTSSPESFTLRSPYDFSAMDITYVEGAEVQQQVKELLEEFKTMTLDGQEARKVALLAKCDARFDIFHFEQVDSAAEDDDQMDPGGLLLVMKKLSELSRGVGLDPQSFSLM